MSNKGLEINKYRIVVIDSEVSGRDIFQAGNWTVEVFEKNPEIKRIIRFDDLGNEKPVAILISEGKVDI